MSSTRVELFCYGTEIPHEWRLPVGPVQWQWTKELFVFISWFLWVRSFSIWNSSRSDFLHWKKKKKKILALCSLKTPFQREQGPEFIGTRSFKVFKPWKSHGLWKWPRVKSWKAVRNEHKVMENKGITGIEAPVFLVIFCFN